MASGCERIKLQGRGSMSRLTYCSTLDDAYFFLNQSKYLSGTPSIRPLQQRYIRACILHSWIALEEMLDHAIQDLEKLGKMNGSPPGPLSQKLQAALKARDASAFSPAEFAARRKVRNLLVHPVSNQSEEHLLTVDEASRIFQYCLDHIRAVYPHSVTLRI